MSDVPGAPILVSAVGINGYVRLAWTLPAGTLTSIKIYRGTAPGAAVYQIFLDGKAIGIQPAYAGTTQGFSIPVTCGKTHTLNVRAGDSRAKAGSTTGWGPLGTKLTWTVPPC